MQKRVSIRLQGQVQGIGFRFSAKQKALELGLTGWVRNEPDGSVMAVAEGKASNLKDYIAWCQKGSRLAQIIEINSEWQDATGEFKDFDIRY